MHAYNPIGDDVLTYFTQTLKLRQDIYGDVKHGSRINDILITDRTVSDILCDQYGANFFDKLSGDAYWVSISDSVMPDDISAELGVMLLSCNMYSKREVAVPRYNNAREILEKIDKQYNLFDF